MSEVHSGGGGWLTLAAAPTFAMMALTTSILGHGPGYVLCSSTPRCSAAWSRCTC